MRRWIRVIAPVLILAVALVAARAILGGRPAPDERPPAPPAVPIVEVMTLERTSHVPRIRGRGIVRPTRTGALVSEVGGTVTAVADAFVVGGVFARGETLVRIDERDHVIALTRARANLARADAQLEEQRALAEQAAREWRQLGRRGQPSPLTLREPQLAAARAERDAAAAELERAELDLERTRIRAPYAGRVLERGVEPGQFVARGTLLGRVHALAPLEVVVPLGPRQVARLALPADGAAGGTGDEATEAPARAELIAGRGDAMHRWAGTLVRVEGVNAATQQLDVVVGVAVQEGSRATPPASLRAPPRVGLQVEVIIEGRTLDDVFVVPRTALRENGEVLLVGADGGLRRRAVETIWSDVHDVVIGVGLAPGEQLVLTPLSSVVDGAPVRTRTRSLDAVPDEHSGDTTGGGS